MRSILAFLFLTMPATAAPVALRYETVPAHSFEAVSVWKDLLRHASSPSVLVAQEGDFFVTILLDRTVCPTFDRCPVRVFDSGFGVLDIEPCDFIAAHTIDAEARRFTACGESYEVPEGEGDI